MLFFPHMHPIRLTSEQVKKLVRGIKSLDRTQRELIVGVLERLRHSHDERVSTEELRKELSRLRADHKISEIDVKAVTNAVFGS